MSGYVEEAQNIIREDGPLIFAHRMLAKTYRTTLRRLMPEVGYPELNGVVVPEYGGGAPGKKLFDDLAPTRWYRDPRTYNPTYEGPEVDGVKKFVSGRDDVVVIGGGYGVTAVHAANNTSGRVTVVEADQERYQNLTRTFEANGVSNQIRSLFGYLGDLHIDLDDSDIPMIAYQDIPEADVWDMDCEGAEVEILQNLPYKPSVILVETHDNHDEVTNLLESNGYELLEIIRKSEKLTHIRARAA
jgi:hypothetical protein